MKLRIIKWKNVIDSCQTNQRMLKAFKRFYEVAIASDWSNPHDIIITFNKSDLIICKKESTTRIVFNIGHNKYRLIVGYYFAPKQTIIYVKFSGTHKEYDSINVCKVEMFKNNLS